MIKKSSNKPPLRCSLRPITSNDSVSPSKPELSDDELAGPSPPPNLNRTVDGYDVHQGNNPGPSRLNRSRPPVADHGRRFKKPKLDAGAENDELQPEIVEKRPLRGRDAQQEGHPTTAPVAARKLRRASNNTAALKMPSPPVPASQTSSAPRTGRGRGSPGAPHLTVNGDTDDQHMTTAPRPNGVTDNGIAEIPPAVKSSGFRASVARERRSLRSHDGISRSKSELALYFPNYEEVLSLQPTKPGKFYAVAFSCFSSYEGYIPLCSLNFRIPYVLLTQSRVSLARYDNLSCRRPIRIYYPSLRSVEVRALCSENPRRNQPSPRTIQYANY